MLHEAYLSVESHQILTTAVPHYSTYYGFYYPQFKDHKTALEKAISTTVKPIKEEFNNFLSNKKGAKERYYTIV